jgi:hypothetical protein
VAPKLGDRPIVIIEQGEIAKEAFNTVGLRVYPLRDMPELLSKRRTATQDYPTISGQY